MDINTAVAAGHLFKTVGGHLFWSWFFKHCEGGRGEAVNAERWMGFLGAKPRSRCALNPHRKAADCCVKSNSLTIRAYPFLYLMVYQGIAEYVPGRVPNDYTIAVVSKDRPICRGIAFRLV